MKPSDSNSPWKGLALTSAIGIDIVICLGIGYWIGNWFSEYFIDSSFWVLGGLLFGLLLSILSIYPLVKLYGGLK